GGAYAKDIVIAADHPDAAARLEDALCFLEPRMGKTVVGSETVELVPIIVDRVDLASVGTGEIAPELEIIRRVCKDDVDRSCGERAHRLYAIALQDAVERQLRGRRFGCPLFPCRRLDPLHHTHAARPCFIAK